MSRSGPGTTSSSGNAVPRSREDDIIERMKGRGQQIPGMAPEAQASLNRTAGYHVNTIDVINRATSVNERTNAYGEETTLELARQGETLQHSNDMVEVTLDNLRAGKVTIRDIKRQMTKEKITKALIIFGLVVTIIVIIYFKWMRHKSQDSTDGSSAK